MLATALSETISEIAGDSKEEAALMRGAERSLGLAAREVLGAGQPEGAAPFVPKSLAAWTYLPRKEATSPFAVATPKFCAKWKTRGGGELTADGSTCLFQNDAMRLVEMGHAPHTGTWQAEFKVLPSGNFDPDGAYVGVQWVSKRVAVSARGTSDVEGQMSTYPGSGRNSWGWREKGR